MAKDPAILWYWNDWNGGTSTFNRHLKGCYMDLLSAQFNSGRLSLSEIKTVLGQDQASWTVLSKKFKQDDRGLFFNERLDTEMTKRKVNSQKQRDKVNKRWHPDTVVDTAVLPKIENENELGKEGPGENPLAGSNLFRKPRIPTKHQVWAAFENQGGTKEMAKAFFGKHEAAGWFLNGSPIVSFASLIPSFISNWKKNNQRNGREENSSAPPLRKVNQ